MTASAPNRSLWGQLSSSGRILFVLGLAIAIALAVFGGIIWRIHMSDDFYYVGIGLIASSGVLMWLVYFSAKWVARGSEKHDT
jgi:hypothetical protein